MSNYYSDDDIEKLYAGFSECELEYKALQERVARKTFGTDKGKEFAQHGFLRRCSVMRRSIEQVFECLPLELEEVPDNQATKDAAIHLQCFYINLFGSMDNLAWTLVYEKPITGPGGKKLHRAHVGLRQCNKSVLGALSDNLNELLNKHSAWMDHIVDFRDALAHRIPLYVPPFVILEENEKKYSELEQEGWKQLSAGNLDEFEAIKEKKEALHLYRPWFTHSFSEKSKHLVIHPQMLANFKTVLEVGRAAFDELE